MDERVQALPEGKNFAHVATIRKDGRPQLNTSWVMGEGENLVINSSLGNSWVRNMERDPRVTLTVTDHEDPYVYALVYGRVIGMETEGAYDVLNRLAKKYLDVDEYPFHRAHEVRVTITIAPERVIYKG